MLGGGRREEEYEPLERGEVRMQSSHLLRAGDQEEAPPARGRRDEEPLDEACQGFEKRGEALESEDAEVLEQYRKKRGCPKKKKVAKVRAGLQGRAWILRKRRLKEKEVGKTTTGTRTSERALAWGELQLPASEGSFGPLAATGETSFAHSFALDERLIFPDPSDAGDGKIHPTSSGLGLGQAKGGKSVACESSDVFVLGNLMSWLDTRVDVYLGGFCKTLSTGRLFPLPASPCVLVQLFPSLSDRARSVLRCQVVSLNSLNGEGLEGPEQASEYQVKVLEGLVSDCLRVESWSMEGKAPTWREFFRVKGVDYKGEEVLTAQVMRWKNVAPALPPEVGSVSLQHVVELGCRHYVENFEEYLLEVEDQEVVKPPRVLVPPEDWGEFCGHLLEMGVFSRVHEDDLYRVRGQPVLNGLFGVSKQEWVGSVEVMRLIMNMTPVNAVVRSFDGDISTLPSWAGMSPFQIQPHEELVISSEDVRAFFYIFRVPTSWHRFLAFNRPLPPELGGDRAGRWYPCSAVLPMGFRNSVSLAQHVHRFVLKQSLKGVQLQGGEAELRKDRPFSNANPVHRVYLDNFDELEKVSKESAGVIRGTVSPLVAALRKEYSSLGIPRHPKKGVARQAVAEVQGAIVDGQLGIAFPKVEKVLKYAHLASLLLQAGKASQKQMQIVGGGCVYIAMFRRPLSASIIFGSLSWVAKATPLALSFSFQRR